MAKNRVCNPVTRVKTRARALIRGIAPVRHQIQIRRIDRGILALRRKKDKA